MKKTIGILLFLLIIIVVLLPYLQSYFSPDYHYVSFSSTAELQEYLSYNSSKIPLVAAHRGGPMAGYPENAISTFQHSLSSAPCLIECDVRKTSDGHLILMHDDSLHRTTTGTGRVSEYTLSQLKILQLKDPLGKITEYRIPTLVEAVEWARDKAILELDIKGNIEPSEIFSRMSSLDALAFTVVITYTNDQVTEYMKVHPELMISASAHTVEGVHRILNTGIDTRRLLVFTGVTEPDTAVYSLLHQLGIRAILGTMHNIDRAAEKRGVGVYMEVLERGADILATDNVPLAAKAIENFVQNKKVYQ